MHKHVILFHLSLLNLLLVCLPKQVKEELLTHCNNVFQTEINILNCRLSNIRTNNDYDILLFVKDSYSYHSYWIINIGLMFLIM